LQPKRCPLGLVIGDYIMFFSCKFQAVSWRINASFSFICLWQNSLSL